MRKLRSNILFIPFSVFLAVVLSGLTLPIHHVHAIEHKQPLGETQRHGHEEAEPHQTSPSTYHEIHFVKLLSEDSFNASSPTDGISSIAHFNIAIVPSTIDFSAPTISSIQSSPFQGAEKIPARDRCVLFCSFLI